MRDVRLACQTLAVAALDFTSIFHACYPTSQATEN